ncbi:MAG: hypothetical protein JWP78_2219 [Mucilaginibacter sp.]|nr:hypothetical protein [Mucilaginibacter sp.]
MNKSFSILLLLVSLCACVKKQQKPSCAIQVCSDVFAIVTIKFLDKDGNQIAVDNYTALDQRTHEVLHDHKLLAPGAYPSYYEVADDSDLKKISADGDDISVTGTDPLTHQTKTAIVKVAGGCACHVNKLSGTDLITFD